MVSRLTVLLFVLAYSAESQTLVLDSRASEINFTIANFGIDVLGNFSGMQGRINFSTENPDASFFEIQIPTVTIETGIGLRDRHLKNEAYFHSEKHPFIRFTSKQIRKTKEGSFEVTGLLSIKNITKEISFPFQVLKMKDIFRFTGKLTINRRDFEVGKNSLTMSDYVNVKFNVVATANPL